MIGDRPCAACGLPLFDEEPEVCAPCEAGWAWWTGHSTLPPAIQRLWKGRALGPMYDAIVDAEVDRIDETAAAWAMEHLDSAAQRARYTTAAREAARERLRGLILRETSTP